MARRKKCEEDWGYPSEETTATWLGWRNRARWPGWDGEQRTDASPDTELEEMDDAAKAGWHVRGPTRKSATLG